MQDHVFKLTEIVGTSSKGSDDAIKTAIARAGKSIRNIRWFEVTNTRGFVDEQGVTQFQITLKVGFTLEDNAAERRSEVTHEEHFTGPAGAGMVDPADSDVVMQPQETDA